MSIPKKNHSNTSPELGKAMKQLDSKQNVNLEKAEQLGFKHFASLLIILLSSISSLSFFKLDRLKNEVNNWNIDKFTDSLSWKGEIASLSWKKLANNPMFQEKLNQVASNIWANPSDLIDVIFAESYCNPSAVNKTSGATWLIQFMPDTAKSLWTTCAELRRMSWIQQLVYVEKYYKQFSSLTHWHYSDVTSLYLATFFPAAIWKWPNYVFLTKHISAKKIRDQNPWIAKFSDRKDGYIDNKAFAKYVATKKRKHSITFV